MTKKLELRFVTGEGKSRVIGINSPILDLAPEIVEKAMDTIIAQDMFEVEGVKLYTRTKGARYVTRTVEDIFEVE